MTRASVHPELFHSSERISCIFVFLSSVLGYYAANHPAFNVAITLTSLCRFFVARIRRFETELSVALPISKMGDNEVNITFQSVTIVAAIITTCVFC